MIRSLTAANTISGDAYVLGPAFAIDSRPGEVCFSEKFSSSNFSP